MYRFYCPTLSDLQPVGLASASAAELIVHLDPDETHHARRVLRMELGQGVSLFDGQGRMARGTLAAWNDGVVAGPGGAAGGTSGGDSGGDSGGVGGTLRVTSGTTRGHQGNRKEGHGGRAMVRVEEMSHVPQPRPVLDLAVAIPKGGHADDMIAGLSQLGVHQLFPLRAQRAVVDPRPAKIERFNRAAIESAKQCGRPYLMSVSSALTLQEVFALDHDLRLIATPPLAGAPESAGGAPAAEIADRLRSATRVLILIGPEGGWSPDELSSAAAGKCLAWSLGANILRIETAAAAAAAIAGYLAHAQR